ncbi:MAG TPA: hypothetical protein VG960_10350 [Caulobacteraceae bacterium]|nr:hypothetical protein [Caulobacteraceae bacterium]
MKFCASLLAANALVLPLVALAPSAQAITLCKDNTASGKGEHDCRLHGGWKLSAVTNTGGSNTKPAPQQGLYSTSPVTAVGQQEKKNFSGSDTDVNAQNTTPSKVTPAQLEGGIRPGNVDGAIGFPRRK